MSNQVQVFPVIKENTIILPAFSGIFIGHNGDPVRVWLSVYKFFGMMPFIQKDA